MEIKAFPEIHSGLGLRNRIIALDPQECQIWSLVLSEVCGRQWLRDDPWKNIILEAYWGFTLSFPPL